MKRIVLLISLMYLLFPPATAQVGRDSVSKYSFKAPFECDTMLTVQDTEEVVSGCGLINNDDMTVKNILAFRTNVLLPLLNAGLEIPIGKHFTVAGDIYYPWIGYDKINANCIQAMAADVQMRWWIRPREIKGLRGNTMTGPVLSLGCYAGLCDFERNGKGVQGEIYGIYLDYGYTFWLAYHCRLTLCAGIGTAHIPYRTYTVYEGSQRLIRDNANIDSIKQWYGPVHVGVTLSVPVTGGRHYENN